MTKKYKAENFDQVYRERDLFMLALNDQLNGAVCWSHWTKDPYSEGKYRVGACRLESASGGLLIMTFRHPRQMDYTTVWAADGFEAGNPAIQQAVYEARTSYRAESVCTAADGHVKTISASNGEMRLVDAGVSTEVAQ